MKNETQLGSGELKSWIQVARILQRRQLHGLIEPPFALLVQSFKLFWLSWLEVLGFITAFRWPERMTSSSFELSFQLVQSISCPHRA
jgi:hypothetical protein